MGDEAEFTNCTFDQNGGDYTFCVGMFVHYRFFLRNCSIGNSTFRNEGYVEIVDTDAENGAASIFGEGSLAMIVAILALAASSASLFLTVAFNKKRGHMTEKETTENNE